MQLVQISSAVLTPAQPQPQPSAQPRTVAPPAPGLSGAKRPFSHVVTISSKGQGKGKGKGKGGKSKGSKGVEPKMKVANIQTFFFASGR